MLSLIGANRTSACSLRSSGIITMPAAVPSPGLRGAYRLPSTVMLPPVAGWAPATVWMSLLRPEPMSPATPTISPARTSRSTGPRPSAVSPFTLSTTGASAACGGGSVLLISPPTISLISRSSVASWGVRSATSLPLRSTRIRSLTARTSSSRWPMNSTVPFRSATCRARPRTISASTGPSAEVGSSRISSFGALPQALAISISCLVGTGSARTSRLTPPNDRGSRPMSRSISSASARVAARSTRPPRLACLGRRPSSRFSATESWPTSGNSWETMAMPSRAAASVDPGARCTPSISMSPPSGCTEPASAPISVDLPAPFSPTTPTTSPA